MPETDDTSLHHDLSSQCGILTDVGPAAQQLASACEMPLTTGSVLVIPPSKSQ